MPWHPPPPAWEERPRRIFSFSEGRKQPSPSPTGKGGRPSNRPGLDPDLQSVPASKGAKGLRPPVAPGGWAPLRWARRRSRGHGPGRRAERNIPPSLPPPRNGHCLAMWAPRPWESLNIELGGGLNFHPHTPAAKHRPLGLSGGFLSALSFPGLFPERAFHSDRPADHEHSDWPTGPLVPHSTGGGGEVSHNACKYGGRPRGRNRRRGEDVRPPNRKGGSGGPPPPGAFAGRK